MDRHTSIRTDGDESIDDWIETLRDERDYWGPTMDAVARATLRIMARSDDNYTTTSLWHVFADPDYRKAFIRNEQTGDDTHEQAFEVLAIEDDALFSLLAQRVQPSVERATAPT